MGVTMIIIIEKKIERSTYTTQ
jgi:hypothetical protein